MHYTEAEQKAVLAQMKQNSNVPAHIQCVVETVLEQLDSRKVLIGTLAEVKVWFYAFAATNSWYNNLTRSLTIDVPRTKLLNPRCNNPMEQFEKEIMEEVRRVYSKPTAAFNHALRDFTTMLLHGEKVTLSDYFKGDDLETMSNIMGNAIVNFEQNYKLAISYRQK